MLKVLAAIVMLLAGFTQDQKASLEGLGVVQVQYVNGTHWAFPIGKAERPAIALRTANGKKWILINVDADQSDFESWFLHEMAHHVAWQLHGERIAEHGPEFQRICRQLVTHRTNYFCKGD
jgi:hypothetical protein